MTLGRAGLLIGKPGNNTAHLRLLDIPQVKCFIHGPGVNYFVVTWYCGCPAPLLPSLISPCREVLACPTVASPSPDIDADLTFDQTAWGDSGVYYCSVVSAQDLQGNNEAYAELIVLGECSGPCRPGKGVRGGPLLPLLCVSLCLQLTLWALSPALLSPLCTTSHLGLSVPCTLGRDTSLATTFHTSQSQTVSGENGGLSLLPVSFSKSTEMLGDD